MLSKATNVFAIDCAASTVGSVLGTFGAIDLGVTERRLSCRRPDIAPRNQLRSPLVV